jgi:hypothetical protein
MMHNNTTMMHNSRALAAMRARSAPAGGAPTTFAFKEQLAAQLAAGIPWLPLATIWLTRPPIP